MILVAHRGAPTLAPENTLRSIMLAQGLAADAVEFDVRGTRDGVPVLLHDKTLERFWGRPETVDALDFAEVRTLTTRAPDGEIDRIPTFEEVIDATTMTLLVDCKAASIVPTIVALLRDRGQFARSKFIGEASIMEAVRNEVSDARIVMSWPKPELPPPDLLARVRPDALNLKWTDETAAFMPRLLTLGYPVWVYPVDDAVSARRARHAGVSALISNDLAAIAPGLVD